MPFLAAKTPICDDAFRGSGGSGWASARWGKFALSVNSALALLCGVFCLAFAHGGTAADSGAQSIEVVAVAADVHAIVVRDASAQLVRYGEGATIAGTAWRVARVSGDRATLVSMQRLRGSVVELPLRAGDHVDLGALTAQLVDAQQPHMRPSTSNVGVSRRNVAPAH